MYKTGGTEVLELEQMDKPVPKIGQVLVKVKSISINFADVLVRRGHYPYMPDFPATPGAECTGYIERVGPGVKDFTAGQAVLVFGKPCYSSYLAVSQERVFPIPEGVDLDEAAALPVTYLTAWHMLHTMRRVREHETILLYAAAGGVGTAVLQLAKLAGARVIGLTSNETKADYLRKAGCWQVINYKTENVLSRVMDVTHGLGADLILDSVGGESFKDNFRMLNTLGQIIWLGISGGMPRGNILKTFARNPAPSYTVSVFHLFSIIQNRPLLRRSLQNLIQLLAEGKIKPVIHERLPLLEAGRAHDMLEQQQNIGKIILHP
ncbi:NADPH:quinone reductase [Flammeovirgaceae bacterium 311]|nr:NADPH:quinone reductase [Flammeovirgaceae bacterium 311]